MIDFVTEIDKKYASLELSVSNEKRLNILNDIIQLKQASIISNRNYNRTLYLDIKFFLLEYIKCLLQKDSNYDSVNFEAIEEKICILDSDEGINALKFLERELRKEYRDSDFKKCHYLRKTHERLHYKSKKGIKALTIYLFLLATSNFISILISLSMLIFAYSVITYPLDGFPIKLFFIKESSYCRNEFWNHLFNIISELFHIDDSKVIPSNIGGVITMVLIKIVFFIVIGEYLIAEFQKRVSFE